MPMVGRAIRRKEDQALHALLTLARQISGADFTYWGIVRDGFVIVKDYNFGTESEGFEFELPVGKGRSEEHTSELQSRQYLVCRLLLEKKKYIRTVKLFINSLILSPIHYLHPNIILIFTYVPYYYIC